MSELESELQYTNNPKHQNPGICLLCMCQKDEQSPTHRPNGLDSMFWCKRCGKYLGLHDMDRYYLSEEYKAEVARQKSGIGAPQ